MSLSKFTDADFKVIDQEWQKLMALAKNRCSSDYEFEVVKKAFEFANQAHMNVRRRSGAPYMIHPIQVAEIVITEIGLGYKSITAALLHDVVEDTDYTVEDIKNLFGEKIASLVDGLTKIKTVLDNENQNKPIESLQAENFKRILLTLNDDARVVLIKLADRLHNCRTIEYMPEHKRDKILSETMYVFIPLAHRLGLYSIKSEMENIWLKFKEPDAYADISEKVKGNVSAKDEEIDTFIAPIKELLEKEGHHFQIIKRIKTPYSIWHKMQTKHIPFEQIYDLYAVRIIYDPLSKDDVKERQEAHQIYSSICSLYNENPGRFRNWINSPKSNGYEALHCTMMSRSGIWIEVQIRSRRMDDIAEKGIAAHWSYKREGYITENDTEMDKWLERIQKVLMSDDINNLDLLDLIHSDLVSSEISVFTPKGAQKTIVSGATALDFAYAIHTHIGNRAAAAKVNMKLVPLSQPLKSGDQVEIITIDSATPKKEWLQFLKTRKARDRVIDYFKGSRTELEAEGEHILEEMTEGDDPGKKAALIQQIMEISGLNDKKDMLFKIGLGLISPQIFNVAMSGVSSSRRFTLDGVTYCASSCCNPIPGDTVMGIKDDDSIVHIHKKSCPVFESISSKFGDRIVGVHWPEILRDFPIKLKIKGVDRLGMLNEMSHYISLTMGVNIKKIYMGSENGVFEGEIEMQVRDKQVLEKMIAGISAVDGIKEVVRTDL